MKHTTPVKRPNQPESDSQAAALLDILIRSLVDRPDDVRIQTISADQSTIFEVSVDPEDVRRVIGRKGRTANAVREILTNLAAKAGRRYHFEIMEPTNRVTVALDC